MALPSKVQTRVVGRPVILLLLVLVLSLGAYGCSQQEEDRASAATPDATEDDDPSMSAPKPDRSEGTQDHIFDAKTAQVGDKVLGMEITGLSVYDDDGERRVARVSFSGRAVPVGSCRGHPQSEFMLTD